MNNYLKNELKNSLQQNIKPRKFLKEFRDFAVKGNVIDLAVAVVIGGAFGKIVSSLVADIIMPLIGLIIGGVNFVGWKLVLKEAVLAIDGSQVKPAVVMNAGVFIQNIFDFLIIALAIFFMVKLLSRLKRQLVKEIEAAPEKQLTLTKDQELLTEIRDLLQSGKKQE